MHAQLVLIIFGFILFIVSLKFMADPKSLSRIAKDVADNNGLVYLSGLLPLIFGSIVLVGLGGGVMATHIHLLAGVIGLFLVLQGLYRLLFSDSWTRCLKKYARHRHIHVKVGIVFIIGLLLLLIGFGFIPIK